VADNDYPLVALVGSGTVAPNGIDVAVLAKVQKTAIAANN
jgi:hypothetical protein